MVLKKIVPHGQWPSPIGVDATIYQNRAPTSPRVNRASGRAFFIESTQKGRQTIIEITADGLRDVLPDEYSVQNRVYEYGGSKYDVLADNRIVFSNKDDTVRLLNPDTREVQLIVQSEVLRYSSFSASHASPWVLAIEEDHTFSEPDKVQNYIVAINVEKPAVKRVVSGSDFYYLPQFSLDGSKVSWISWNKPDLPFAAGELYVGNWAADSSIKNSRFIAGRDYESVAEPRWGPDGSLFFGKEMGSHRKLYRIPPGGKSEELIQLNGLDDAEFAEARLAEGSRTFVPLTANLLVATAITNAVSRLIAIDLKTGTWKPLIDDKKLCHLSGDAVAKLDEHSVIAIGNGTISHKSVYKIDVANPKNNTIIRKAIDEKFPDNLFAHPETIHVRSKGSPPRDIYGFLWMPRNPKYTAPNGQLPPLIINTHGGPTGHTGSGLNLRTQYFTSRGYAYLELNYTGSTGHGRKYRESLFGNWGIVDSADVVEAADYLVSSGRVNPDAIGITGASAGGYNTLQCLSRYPGKFAGGVAVCSISELESFNGGTHKLESDYTDALVLHPGVSEEEKHKIFHDRSALYRADNVDAPLLLLHGQADTVVPIQQARVMAEALKKLDRDVEIIEVEDEGHMFSKPSSARLWLEEEERWWKKTFA